MKGILFVLFDIEFIEIGSVSMIENCFSFLPTRLAASSSFKGNPNPP